MEVDLETVAMQTGSDVLDFSQYLLHLPRLQPVCASGEGTVEICSEAKRYGGAHRSVHPWLRRVAYPNRQMRTSSRIRPSGPVLKWLTNEEKAKEHLRVETGPTTLGEGACKRKVGASTPFGRAPAEISQMPPLRLP